MLPLRATADAAAQDQVAEPDRPRSHSTAGELRQAIKTA